MAGNPNVISLEIEDFIQGGLINDVDVEVQDLQFVGWDYDGHINDKVLAVKGTLLLLDEHGRPDPNSVVDQYWSAGGDFSLVGVSDDGYTLLPGANKTALTKGSNLELLLASLRGKGLPKGYMADGNLSKLKGMRMHVIRQAVKREGLPGRGEADKEKSTLVCSNLIWGPWMTGKPPAGATATRTAANRAANGAANGAPARQTTTNAPAQQAQAPAAAAAAPDADIEASAVDSVTRALQAVEGNMFATVKDLKVAVFRLHSKDKADVRNQIVKLAEDVAWLESKGFGVMDGSVLLGA